MPQSQFPRNVFVHDANVPQNTNAVLVAGFCQFGQTTGDGFYFCLEFCFQEPVASGFRLMGTDGVILPRDLTIVPIGSYYVVTPSE